MTFDLFGIGNPLMDVLVEVDEAALQSINLKKGSFNLVDESQLKIFESNLNSPKLVPGGSVANVVSLFAQLGGKACFCGKVGNDEFALKYEQSMRDIGLTPYLSRLPEHSTGRALTFITPDSERTFATHLGAAIQLKKEDIDLEQLKQSKMLHLSGYVLEDPNLQEAAIHALEIAKENNIQISIDVADPDLVLRCKSVLRDIIIDFADIVFANEQEAQFLTNTDNPTNALNELSTYCDIAIVKLGKQGSLIKQGDTVIQISPNEVEAVDTTGAGDSYAGAFLFALSEGHSLRTAGELGSYLSSRVVEQIGARLEKIPELDHII